jgi:hypothetical protein
MSFCGEEMLDVDARRQSVFDYCITTLQKRLRTLAVPVSNTEPALAL